jgi:hypothetical protein
MHANANRPINAITHEVRLLHGVRLALETDRQFAVDGRGLGALGQRSSCAMLEFAGLRLKVVRHLVHDHGRCEQVVDRIESRVDVQHIAARIPAPNFALTSPASVLDEECVRYALNSRNLGRRRIAGQNDRPAQQD